MAPHHLLPHPGLRTGCKDLDDFLLWKGLPKGALSLFVSVPGLGATSLWLQTALAVTQEKKWAAWVESPGQRLCPWFLQQTQADLSRFLVISAPDSPKKLCWVLSELVSLALFETIACDVGKMPLWDSQILQLKRLARRYQVALVLMGPPSRLQRHPFFSLILEFQPQGICIQRAIHRPTPYFIERRPHHAYLMPQLASLPESFHR